MDAALLRLGLAIGLLLAGAMLAGVAARFGRSGSRAKLAALGALRHGAADKLLVYFTSPDCVPCRAVQEPAIDQVQAQLGSQLEVVQIDATAQPELADRWGVLSVPTTFLVRAGQIRQVNRGVVRAEQLRRQIDSL